MKTIIHTQFLEDICEELELTALNVGIKSINITAEWLSNHMALAFEMLRKDVNCNDDELLCDLVLLQDLEGVDYATPNHIASSIETLSTKLSEQLEAKVFGEANYNEYYCHRLAEVLKELCEIIL